MPTKSKPRAAPWKVVKVGSVEIVIYREGEKRFRIAWYVLGKRHRARRASEAEAVDFAKKKALALAGPTGQTEDQLETDRREYAQLKAKMGKVPVYVAVDYYIEHHARQKIVPATLASLLPEFLERMREDQKSPSYIKAVHGYVGPYVKDFPGIINDQNSTEIDRWMRKRTTSLHSRKHFLQYLRTVFNWARDVKKALPKGETEADMVETPEPKAGAIEIYTPEEMRLMLDYAKNDEEKALLALGGFVGLRNSEITGDRTAHGPLQIKDILFADSAVKVIQKAQQNSTVRYAPIPANALTWLNPLRGKSGPVVGFKEASVIIGEIIGRVNAKHKAGLSMKRNGLRRSHISYRTAILRDVARVADECNTSPAKIRANYRVPGLEDSGHKWYAISRLTALAPPCPLPTTGAATPEVQSGEK